MDARLLHSEGPMSVVSAKAYITRMREDVVFHQTVNACEEEAANWAFLRQNGYEFTQEEFKTAVEEIYAERGITPL
jgi:predicted ribosomally synthesized peptide with nif11-like leader